MMSVEVIQGDARRLPFADDSMDLIVTSPPYFGLRSYTDGGEHYDGQIGAEATPAAYVDALIECTREWLRTLKPEGSLWVNLGDRFRGGSLAGLPWRYALACTDTLGLLLRGELVWSKPDRFIDARATGRVRRTHEVFLHFTTTTKAYANDAVRVPASQSYQDRPQYRRAVELFTKAGLTDAHLRAVRSVGIIDSAGGRDRSGGSWDSESGRLAAEVRSALGSYYRELCGSGGSPIMPSSVSEVPTPRLRIPAIVGSSHTATFPVGLISPIIEGWSPEDGTVLDPFGGTGTTALTADVLGRHGITVDMSADYCRVARWRINDPAERERARIACRSGQERTISPRREPNDRRAGAHP